MMDKKPHIKPYLYGMLAGFGAISLSILFFFFIYRFDGFGDAVSKVTGILMPFIYGAVIAYLLKPVCNTIEGFLHRIFPEKLHSMASMLAIAATLLFGVLVVYALVMMVVPQLITSVTSLYYTAQTSITRFMQWVNTQKVFLDNETLMGYFNNAYDAIADNLTALRTTLLPSLQNLQGILSGVGVGVMSVVTWFKNLLIGLIVAVYLLASRKKFAKQAKMILRHHWCALLLRLHHLQVPERTAGVGHHRRHQRHPLLRSLHRCRACNAAHPHPESHQGPLVRALRSGAPAAGRQRHRPEDPGQHHRPFELLGALLHPAVRRSVGLRGHDRGRAAVRRHL